MVDVWRPRDRHLLELGRISDEGRPDFHSSNIVVLKAGSVCFTLGSVVPDLMAAAANSGAGIRCRTVRHHAA